eukprot:m.1137339 g.1137339  ORF g.1137339 m.1137339 type:complete len:354 (+) comp24435_c0_seq16:194-1255(+)
MTTVESDPHEKKRARVDVPAGGNLSSSEATQYDRQIRLWGLEAQKRLRASRVLVIGTSGVAAELCKNIVLSGIGSLTLLDNNIVSPRHLASQFFLSESDIGKNIAVASLPGLQRLNPNVEIKVDTQDVSDKTETFFTEEHFDIVCATGLPLSGLARVDEACRKGGVKFFAAGVVGFQGFTFANLLDHEFIEEKKIRNKTGDDTVVKERHHISFVSLASAMAHKWGSTGKIPKHKPMVLPLFLIASQFHEKFNRDAAGAADLDALKQVRSAVMRTAELPEDAVSDAVLATLTKPSVEIGPVCAVVGGILGAEVIKAISRNDRPHTNFFFYDGLQTTGQVLELGDEIHKKHLQTA